jgi:hypothetical protein
MLVSIVEVERCGGYRLRLRFEDGAEGEVDIAEVVPFTGVFARFADHAFFELVRVDPAWGSLSWPEDLDLAPEPLYERVTGCNPYAGAPVPPDRAPDPPRADG